MNKGLSKIKKISAKFEVESERAKRAALWLAPEVLCGQEVNEKSDMYRCVQHIIHFNYSSKYNLFVSKQTALGLYFGS